MIKKIDKIFSGISNAIGYVSYVGLVAIMLLIVVDVLLRKLMKTGIVGSYELVERMLLITIFAAFAFTQTHRGHIHVTLFLTKLPKTVRMFLFGFFGLLSTAASAFCAYSIMAQGSFSFTAATFTAVLKIPLYPFFYIAAFCMLIFTFTLLWDSIKCFAGMKNDEIREDIQSSWE